jgi:hypothetical protein
MLASLERQMFEMINAMRPYLEALYFLAGIGLFAGVLIGYRQLMVIRRDVQIRNQRAAMEKAIEASDCYFNKFIPLSGEFLDEKLAKKVSFLYTGPIGDFSPESIPKELTEDTKKRFHLDSYLPAMNQLESLASYFVSGVADDSTGYQIIGRTFCSWVELNYDVIAYARRQRVNPYWANIVQLYQLWRPRFPKALFET